MKSRLRTVLSHLRRVVLRHGEGGLSDGLLLERFVRQQDEAAFEVLVWRHGPMVLGVGRRVLHNLDDAEDILQATFLALVRQARSIQRSESVAGWLYQVAYRLALRVRQQKQRLSGQAVIEDIAAPSPERGEYSEDELSLLDEELQRLPEKYRIPLVLSYLQGMTNQEIATRMTCPIGTVFTRLARGRDLLRKRLVRRGVLSSTGVLSIALPPGHTMAMHVELVRATVQAGRTFAEDSLLAASHLSPHVVALAKGVEKMTTLSRRKLVGVVLTVLAILGSGVGLLAWPAAELKQANPSQTAPALEQSVEAPTPRAEGAKPDAPQDKDRPKIISVFPADGATEVEPITEIRIRFDRPMEPSSAVLEGDPHSGQRGWYRPRGEMRYDAAVHEFVFPVQLVSGQKIVLHANPSFLPPGEGEDYKGFRSKDHTAAKPYQWSFTTKKQTAKEGKRPRVISLNPPSDTEVSLLTPLEVTFDQAMDPDFSGIPAKFARDRFARVLTRAHYDPEQRLFRLLLELPANWNGELRLEEFRSKEGVEAEPVVIKYRTLRSVQSEALTKRIEKASQAKKLIQLVERVRKARRGLQSVSEEVVWAHSYGQHPYWCQSFQMQGAHFQMQGKQKYLGVIDGITDIPFRIGCDGTTCWVRRNKERMALPVNDIKEKHLLFCDPFRSASADEAERIIQEMKLEYLGEAKIRGRRCHQVRSWLAELSDFDYLSPIRDWYIDADTLLPMRVEMAESVLQTIDFIHSRVNEPIPDKEFSPDDEPGVKAVEAKPLGKDYTSRFLNVIDGSNGRMSVRWGEKGPKGMRSSGLN